MLARVNALDVRAHRSIWTHDLDRAHRLASRVEAGYVWINGASTHHVGVPVRRLQAVGHRPRGIDRGVARLHADQERQRDAAQRTTIRQEEDHHATRSHRSFAGALSRRLAATAAAEEIAVGNYGVSANGMPFGVALAKGYFKEEGLNITGLISSAGGGTRCATCWPAAASPTAK